MPRPYMSSALQLKPYKPSANGAGLWMNVNIYCLHSRILTGVDSYELVIFPNAGETILNIESILRSPRQDRHGMVSRHISALQTLKSRHSTVLIPDRVLTPRTPIYALSPLHFLYSAIRMQDIHCLLCVSRASFIPVKTLSPYLHEDVVLRFWSTDASWHE